MGSGGETDPNPVTMRGSPGPDWRIYGEVSLELTGQRAAFVWGVEAFSWSPIDMNTNGGASYGADMGQMSQVAPLPVLFVLPPEINTAL